MSWAVRAPSRPAAVGDGSGLGKVPGPDWLSVRGYGRAAAPKSARPAALTATAAAEAKGPPARVAAATATHT